MVSRCDHCSGHTRRLPLDLRLARCGVLTISLGRRITQKMGSIVTKGRGDQAYVYLVESARVDGKPRIVDQVYLGTKREVLDRLTSKDPGLPDQSEHRSFGDVAAAWQMIEKLGVAAVINEVAGPARVHPSCSVGTYLALAICNRIVGSLLQARVRRLVEDHVAAADAEDPRGGAGPSPVLAGHGRPRARTSWRSSRDA